METLVLATIAPATFYTEPERIGILVDEGDPLIAEVLAWQLCTELGLRCIAVLAIDAF